MVKLNIIIIEIKSPVIFKFDNVQSNSNSNCSLIKPLRSANHYRNTVLTMFNKLTKLAQKTKHFHFLPLYHALTCLACKLASRRSSDVVSLWQHNQVVHIFSIQNWQTSRFKFAHPFIFLACFLCTYTGRWVWSE